MRIPISIALAGFVVLLATGPSVSAKDNDLVLLQSDVVQLQKSVQELQRTMDARNAALTQLLEKLADNVNNLNANMQKVTDSVGVIRTENTAANTTTVSSLAVIGNDTRNSLATQAGQTTAMQKSLNELSQSMTGLNAGMKTLTEQVMAMKSGTSALPSCKDLKQDADRSFISNYYEDAVTGYREFMDQCKTDPKAAEVQFQIAESLYNLKKFDQAVLDYDIFLNNYPANDKTPSALLRKGQALAELKKTPEARAVLTRVTTEFKNTSEAATAASKLKELAPAATSRGRGTP